MRHDYTDSVVAMSLLALGAEKMLKLTIGMSERDQGRDWPTKKVMRENVGHRVLKADQNARALLDAHAGTVPGLLDGMKTQVAADPVLPVVLNALDAFGDAGRFHYLDVLTGATPDDESPQTLWGELTTAMTVGDPALLADIKSTENYERGRQRLNKEITDSLTRWWELYIAAWRTGAIGDEAKRYAHELALEARDAR
ncbi:hypothetical protein [Actinoplanes siamensis]|nr:hypothetical protein [Actinoplanes siamensis]